MSDAFHYTHVDPDPARGLDPLPDAVCRGCSRTVKAFRVRATGNCFLLPHKPCPSYGACMPMETGR